MLAADDFIVGDGLTNVKQPRLTGTVELNGHGATAERRGHQDRHGDRLGRSGLTRFSPSSKRWPTARIPARPGDGRRRKRGAAAGTALSPTIDATAPTTPAAPTLLAADDSGKAGDGITNVRQPRLTGTTEANATVQLLDALGNVLGAATASGTGAYTLSPSAALADGTYSSRVQATDAAGNVAPRRARPSA
ncbi:MAG: Ig-like domain-containing protein [Isosphaeraceae bacterium]